MMKKVLLAVCTCGLLVTVSAVSAEEISKSTLHAMGLSGMQTMSESEGLSVRGMGFAATGGFTFVRDTNWSGDVAVAGSAYVGVSRTRNAATSGSSFSKANSGDFSGTSFAFTTSSVYAK